MGFDWYISLTMHVDPSTGLPYVWGPGFERLPYKPEDYCVPEQYRQFLYMRGHLFHQYTRAVEEIDEVFECDPSRILEHWPCWKSIKDKEEFKYYDWTEEQHNLLKEALKWFSSMLQFKVSWSY